MAAKLLDMFVWFAILDTLSMAFAMFWEILWALVLGFTLSAAIHAVVSSRIGR